MRQQNGFVIERSEMWNEVKLSCRAYQAKFPTFVGDFAFWGSFEVFFDILEVLLDMEKLLFVRVK